MSILWIKFFKPDDIYILNPFFKGDFVCTKCKKGLYLPVSTDLLGEFEISQAMGSVHTVYNDIPPNRISDRIIAYQIRSEPEPIEITIQDYLDQRKADNPSNSVAHRDEWCYIMLIEDIKYTSQPHHCHEEAAKNTI